MFFYEEFILRLGGKETFFDKMTQRNLVVSFFFLKETWSYHLSMFILFNHFKCQNYSCQTNTYFLLNYIFIFLEYHVITNKNTTQGKVVDCGGLEKYLNLIMWMFKLYCLS